MCVSDFCRDRLSKSRPGLEALCGLTLALHGYALDYALGYALGYAQRLGCSYPSGYPSQLVPGLSLLELSRSSPSPLVLPCPLAPCAALDVARCVAAGNARFHTAGTHDGACASRVRLVSMARWIVFGAYGASRMPVRPVPPDVDKSVGAGNARSHVLMGLSGACASRVRGVSMAPWLLWRAFEATRPPRASVRRM